MSTEKSTTELLTEYVFESCQYDLDRFATPTMAPRVLTEEVVKCLAYTIAVDADVRTLFDKVVREARASLHGE